MTVIFMLIMNGCAFLGIDLSDDRTIALQKSPYIVVMDGDIREEDYIYASRVLSFLSTQKFIDDDFKAWNVSVKDLTEVSKYTGHNRYDTDIQTDPQSVTD